MPREHITSWWANHFSTSTIRCFTTLASCLCTLSRMATSWSILFTSSHCHGNAIDLMVAIQFARATSQNQVIFLTIVAKLPNLVQLPWMCHLLPIKRCWASLCWKQELDLQRVDIDCLDIFIPQKWNLQWNMLAFVQSWWESLQSAIWASSKVGSPNLRECSSSYLLLPS